MADHSANSFELPDATPEQRRIVDAAREIWIRRLVDQSRNNTLLFYRDLKVGTLDLTPVPHAVEQLLAGRTLDVDDLILPVDLSEGDRQLPDAAERRRALEADRRREVQHRLVVLQRKALTNLEEKGLETLFLALGMATWPAADGGRPYEAAVLLIPARITSKTRIGEDLRLAVSGEPQANLALLYLLENDFGIKVESRRLLEASAKEDEEGRWRVDPEAAYRVLEQAVRGVREFAIRHRAVLANFQFAKMAMVEDLKRHGEALVRHPIIAAIAGHNPSRQALAAQAQDVDPRSLDDQLADQEHLVLDADSSQQRVIVLACNGQSGVIQGPPGTGKSQTIANLIAELVARGKRVLFVAEKRAALEAVIKRLGDSRVDLGHLVLDLHGAAVSRKEVMARIADTLHKIRHATPVESGPLHREFEARRGCLKRHAERINTTREPTSFSLFMIQGCLLRLPKEAQTDVRWRGEQLRALTPERAYEIREWLLAAAALESLFLGSDASPWNNANIRTGERAEQVIDETQQAARDLWPAFDEELSRVVAAAGIQRPGTLDATDEVVRFFREVANLRGLYRGDLFEAGVGGLATALAPAAHGRLARLWAFLTKPAFRAARTQLRALRKERAPASVLLAEARAAEQLRERWRKFGGRGERPVALGAVRELSEALQALVASVDMLAEVTNRRDLRQAPLVAVAECVRAFAADRWTPFKLPRVYALRGKLADAGVQPLIEGIRRQAVPPTFWSRRFEFAWFHSVLDWAMASDEELATFSGRVHDNCVEDFVRLDQERLRLAADRVRRLHGERAVQAMNEHPEQADLVRREAHKRSRHLPLRELLAKTPDVLTRVAPCWLASPLSVSQLLNGNRRHFDVVLFDEASQVLPEEAVPALLRAQEVVVSGDRHQLPPTTFFTTAIEGEDEENEVADAVEGFESVLDLMAAFLPNWMLEWHYRSEDERLIAFSNHHIYDDRLITFPSARAQDVITHAVVRHDPGLSSQEESASPEVDEVVRRVIAHAETRPWETLGVITMGIKHANRIQAAVDRALQLRLDLADFFSLEREERFFVKNLETVQGDERDAILISIGYGKTSDGDLPHRFGPLTHDSGYRRLNVAVTRARRRVAVISSFHHHEVDLSRSGGRGVQLLKAYLEYAANGGTTLPRSQRAGEVPLNPFEADVRDALQGVGMTLLPQYGTSRYRIDLVATHPAKPGQPVLAIECDGASYHSGATARERDRLRQQQLMRRGWRFHRIWSTDWFHRREEETQRARAAYEEAVRYADVVDAQGEAAGPLTDAPLASSAPRPAMPKREPFPSVPRRGDIEEYSQAELRRVAEWAMSDGLLRPDEDLLRDIREALGFQRLGPRIRRRLEEAIRDARARQRRTGGGPLRLL